MGNGKRGKKPKRRVIEHKPVQKSSARKIQELRDMWAYLDAEEDRLKTEGQDTSGITIS